MKIICSNKIILQDVPSRFTRIIRERLTMPNPVYAEAEKRGRWTGNISRELRFYEDTPEGLIIPRGFARQLLRLATQYEVSWELDDRRRVLPEVEFIFTGKLRDYQMEAVQDVLKHDHGVLFCPTGGGKTIIALAVIAKQGQPALVIVHTKELLHQWIDRAVQFLGMEQDEIGIIGGGKKRIGERLTIGIVNSIYPIAEEIREHFGFAIVDECHHCPSRTFTEAVSAFDCRFMLGLSATPYRRDGLSKLIYWHLGDQVHAVKKSRLIRERSIIKPEIVIRQTGFISSFNLTEKYPAGISDLTGNPERNKLIVDDVVDYFRGNDGPVLILSDRKSHCLTLSEMLVDEGIRAEPLIGDLSTSKRREVVAAIRAGEVQAICATGNLIGEGFDLPAASALFLAMPIKFSGRVIQYAGRVLRPAPGKNRAVIYDYVDSREPVLVASGKACQRAYQKLTA
ncbi:MAG: excinuclease ABC subunit B [Syntrophus sp. PtaB.Bin001]|nr:MAG: excinuclease ABC subunit B [Syntrophus sp. PtaB.Bin001]